MIYTKKILARPYLGLLKELIGNACVNNGDGSAQEIKSVRSIEAYMETHLPQSTYGYQKTVINEDTGRPILVYTYGPDEPGNAVVMCGHLDVVPADAEKWHTNPFEAVFEGDKIIGRGALDMLGPDVEFLEAFSQIVKNTAKDQLNGKLVLAFVPDEEAGCEYGSKILCQEIKKGTFGNWTPKVALFEGGGYDIKTTDGKTNTTVATAHKGDLRLNITIPAEGGHGSMVDQKDNALFHANEVLTELNKLNFPITKHRELMRSAMKGAGITGPKNYLLSRKNPIKLIGKTKGVIGQNVKSQSQTTVSPNNLIVNGGEGAAGVAPGRVEIQIDSRLVKDTTPEQVRDEVAKALKKALGNRATDATIEEMMYVPYAETSTTQFMPDIREAAKKVDPNCALYPVMIPGFTDMSWFRREFPNCESVGTGLHRATVTDARTHYHGTRKEEYSIKAMEMNTTFNVHLATSLLVKKT